MRDSPGSIYMEYVIQGREPASVFRYFEEISAIPRGSYNEGGVADYLVRFARERSLDVYRDDLHNVLIRLPATPGQEGRAPILFQGHTDMVCEKNADVVHDFLTDPIRIRVDGDRLRACGTTLGGDDGIAVAMMLSLLSGEVPSHPAIECLFTTAEEVGLNGAHGFDYSRITARRMVNMDSEELGVVTSGCAGGVRSDLTLKCGQEPLSGEVLRIFVSGLAGGHSGENINCGRANANKVMGRLLAALSLSQEIRLISVNGGSKDNAIPRECEALVAVTDPDAADTVLTDTASAIAAELVPEDRGFRVVSETAEADPFTFGKTDTESICAILSCAQNGVRVMSRKVPGLVESSRNMGVVKTEGNSVSFVFSSRSAIESRLDDSTRELDLLARVCGAECRHYSRYPGWDYAPVSAVRDAYLSAYREVTGENASVNVIHAGLECGIIHSKVPDMDMISVGPTMYDIHSPDEALDLPAVEVFWKTVVRLIEML